ncbi:MAG: inorganic diphosphatase [Alteromonadaceae bacterium]|nr:MAG: inorganic diphosphatase [Alteromonadaceae bacterium]
MRKETLYVFTSLVSICFFILTACTPSHHKDTGNHAVKLVMEDQYTLVSEKHYVRDYPPLDASGNINVVVEIPGGTSDKWEVEKSTGALAWEFREGKPRVVQYLGYPGNYGMIPRTLLPEELGGDGDPLDVIIIGPVVPRGSIVSARPIGILKLLDNGEQDDKIIAVSLNSQLGNIFTLEELNHKFTGVTEIIKIWFSNYKGPKRMESKGFGSVNEAQAVIKTAIEAYQSKLSVAAQQNAPADTDKQGH